LAQTYVVAGQVATEQATRDVVNKAVSGNVVTLTTSVEHKVVVGQTVTLSEGNQIANVVSKVLTSNVATLTTGTNHRIQVGQNITVAISDAVFDGTYVVTSTTANTVSYAKTNANVTFASTSGTITFSDLAFNGSFVVDSNPTPTTFTYSTVSNNLASTAASNFTATYIPWVIVATCPADKSMVISSLLICNQNAVPTRYQVIVADTFDFENKNIIFYNDVLDSLDTITITAGITLDPVNKYLIVAADRETVSASAFAVEVS